MKKTAISLMLAALLPAMNAYAEQGDWVVRLRATNISRTKAAAWAAPSTRRWVPM